VELTQQICDGVVVISVPGRNLDASNAASYKKAFGQARDKNLKIVVDLSAVEFVDSSGLGALLSCLRDLHTDGGDMKLFGVQKPVRVLFELVRMHRVFDIHDTCDQAIAAFAS